MIASEFVAEEVNSCENEDQNEVLTPPPPCLYVAIASFVSFVIYQEHHQPRKSKVIRMGNAKIVKVGIHGFSFLVLHI